MKYKLNLACGNNRQKDFVGVDIVGKPESQADIVWDLLKFPWEFAKDNSVDEVFCSHFLEHIPQGDSYNDPLFAFMDELFRILKPGGTARFVTPYYTSMRAFQDPTHRRFITEGTYNYFNREWREEINQLKHYPVKCNFNIIKIDHGIGDEFRGRSEDVVSFNAIHMWNVVMDLMVTLQKPKLLKKKK